MSTRSHIGIKSGNTIKYIYCHHDGDLECVGIRLLKYYSDIEKLEKLINGGNMSALGRTLESCNYYNEGNYTTDNIQRFATEEFNYYFDVDNNKWFVVFGEGETQYLRDNHPDQLVRYELEKLLHSEATLRMLFEGFYCDYYVNDFINNCLSA